jgi:hypothetical protein
MTPAYDGPASIVTSAGDSFAECHLVADQRDDGWSGTITDIRWRTQMVPTPLNPEERLRVEGLDDKPIVVMTVAEESDGVAQVSGPDDLFG